MFLHNALQPVYWIRDGFIRSCKAVELGVDRLGPQVRDEAGGEDEDKPGEPYSTLKTHIIIISIIKFFNLPPFEN